MQENATLSSEVLRRYPAFAEIALDTLRQIANLSSRVMIETGTKPTSVG